MQPPFRSWCWAEHTGAASPPSSFIPGNQGEQSCVPLRCEQNILGTSRASGKGASACKRFLQLQQEDYVDNYVDLNRVQSAFRADTANRGNGVVPSQGEKPVTQQVRGESRPQCGAHREGGAGVWSPLPILCPGTMNLPAST